MSVRLHTAEEPTPARTRLQEVLDIGEQLRLAQIVDLGDDTGPKAVPQKAPKPKPKPYDKLPKPDDKLPKPDDKKTMLYDALPPPVDDDGNTVKTAEGKKVSTEAEKKWLRDNYGENWSMAEKSLRIELQQQARHNLAFDFAPKIIEAKKLERAAATQQFKDDYFILNENGLLKLDWKTEVLPMLEKKYTANWTMGELNNKLTKEEKDARSNWAKDMVRAEKMNVLNEQLKQYVTKRVQLKVVQVIDELNYPDASNKRKARALLRHWFNREGKPNEEGITARVWNKPDEDKDEDGDKKPKKTVAADVTPEMHKARLKWARSQIGPSYNPSNPPQPPPNLYGPLDIQPLPAEYLPDEVKKISAEGGQWLWTYMRSLEKLDIQAVNYNPRPVDESAKYWNPVVRKEQMVMLKNSYEEFIMSVDEMSEVPQAKNIAYSYTVGSGRFNKYLLWPSSKVNGDPTKIPKMGSGPGGVAGNMDAGQIGPPEELHRLYKLINRCPRLPQPAVFLRAGKTWHEQPHNLGKAAPITPQVGRGYLNVTFMSTSSAPPDQYLYGELATFYTPSPLDGGCCLFAITCPANSPVLPLVLGGAAMSDYETEQEVVLPPGLVLVYQGQKKMNVGNTTPLVNFYQAELPPKLPGVAGPSSAGS